LAALFVPRLETLDPGFGIEVMVLSATKMERLPPIQLSTASRAAGMRRTALAPLVDRLANRLGSSNVVRFLPGESHVPERSVRRLSAFDSAAATASVWPVVEPGMQSRPLRLLSRPEEVEAVAT